MAIKMDNYGNVYNDELFHYGKKGMKWGKHVMAQEKYWLTGNGRTLGSGDTNSRMASDTSGIQWKRTVAPSGGFKPATGKGGAVTPGRTYNRAALLQTLPEYQKVKPSFKRNGRYVNRKVVPTSSPAVKGVNTTPQGGFGAKTYTSKKAEMLKNKDTMYLGGVEKPQRGARNALVLNSSVSNRVGSAMKKGIKAVQSKPDVVKKAKKKAAVGILKLASKMMKWF